MQPSERPFRTVAPGPRSTGKRSDSVVTLRLKDFIDRLPMALLAPGEHDLEREVFFDVSDLARRIAEGRPMMDLVRLQRQLPDLFVAEIKSTDQFLVRFPWRKLIEMLCAANTATPSPGLTRPAALNLAHMLRNHRATDPGFQSSRMPNGTAALARAPQWFVRNNDAPETSPLAFAQTADRALHELAQALEPLAASSSDEPMDRSDAARTADEIARLNEELRMRDQEIDSLRKALSDLEAAAIDQIAALNQHCEEIEAKAPEIKPETDPGETALNPQQSETIAALSQQVSELYAELDRAHEETLLATATHSKLHEKHEASEAASKALEQYLESVAYELERANAILKDMEAKLHLAETAAANKDAELKRLTTEIAELRMERDALRGRLYAMATRDTEPPRMESGGGIAG